MTPHEKKAIEKVRKGLSEIETAKARTVEAVGVAYGTGLSTRRIAAAVGMSQTWVRDQLEKFHFPI